MRLRRPGVLGFAPITALYRVHYGDKTFCCRRLTGIHRDDDHAEIGVHSCPVDAWKFGKGRLDLSR
jgi:hypothetical protein